MIESPSQQGDTDGDETMKASDSVRWIYEACAYCRLGIDDILFSAVFVPKFGDVTESMICGMQFIFRCLPARLLDD